MNYISIIDSWISVSYNEVILLILYLDVANIITKL